MLVLQSLLIFYSWNCGMSDIIATVSNPRLYSCFPRLTETLQKYVASTPLLGTIDIINKSRGSENYLRSERKEFECREEVELLKCSRTFL